MAVRLREADRIAAVAELQQHIAELEIQVTHARMKRVASCSFFLYLFSCPSLSFFLFLTCCEQDTTWQSGIMLSLYSVPPL